MGLETGEAKAAKDGKSHTMLRLDGGPAPGNSLTPELPELKISAYFCALVEVACPALLDAAAACPPSGRNSPAAWKLA